MRVNKFYNLLPRLLLVGSGSDRLCR